jgi:hypothetical protein
LSWIHLKLRLQLLKKDLTVFKAEDTVQGHLISNALHSIFRSAHVSLNGQSVRNVDSNYHIKEFIENSLNFSEQTVQNRLSAQHYGDESSLTSISANSKVFEIYGKINIFNLSKFLIPGVSFTLRLHLESPTFFIVEDVTKTKTETQLKIVSSRLYIRHVVPTNDVILAHERLLSQNKRAIYEYKRGNVITQNIGKGTNNLEILNFYTGIQPSLVVFGMIDNDAYSGSRSKNPLEFKHNSLTSFNFVVNGTSRPVNPYSVEIDEKHECYAHLFSRIYESLGLHDADKSNLLTPKTFKDKMFLIAEDLSVFNLALTDILEVSRSVTIGVSGSFAKSLPQNITCILYLLIPSRIEIAADRSVSLVL